MKISRIIMAGAVLLMMAGIVGTSNAWARTIQATVSELNHSENTVTLQPVNPQGGIPSSLEVNLSEDLSRGQMGIRNLQDLSVGEEITVEIHQSGAGSWEVQNISKSQDLSQQQNRPQASGAQNRGMVSGSPDMLITGTVISKEAANNQIVVMDYATGQERTFTVVNKEIYDTVEEGQTVQIQTTEGVGVRNQPPGQAAAGQTGQTGETEAVSQQADQSAQSQSAVNPETSSGIDRSQTGRPAQSSGL